MSNTLDSHVAAYQSDNLYDFDNEILMTWYPQRILHQAGARSSLLELGLGHGHTVDIFSSKFPRHVVLEGSPAIIQNFRQKHPASRAQIIETYFEEFSTDERFDVIVMGFILEHVDDPLQILRRYRSFLAPGGKMFLAVPNAEVLNRRLGHLAGLLDDVTTLSENDHLLGHKRYYTVSSLRAEVTKADCEIDRLEGIYLKPFTTRQLLNLQLDRKIIDGLCAVGIDYPELSCGILAEVSAK
ncbi:class I SAM-dependent methyltransferase [Paraburkholderia saeva]|uniref:Ubiquinone biosynthesis O-methyltransferase, mitochondrial n=1 Tax=Paraburkholderia saeva TaxID=2777537 RepID=A0A9N8RZ29_9BURK|nr:class I SAM-dependent methyltransferase [Paraburkholderia saeva]CAG4903246.1 Ubiquinone biosynthesis O-methyltransferase, mitochondrial [Paraburkholderia saeva]CAG4905048.1 Ubiquinone biosynthesis O-methyltransferase, mitochondrial [Paraburkholderia saeva]CAG4908905.1 Ubiquinone biosynthesis O-methyltransferase, mitochondrial [Paraburkholderia saeva]